MCVENPERVETGWYPYQAGLLSPNLEANFPATKPR